MTRILTRRKPLNPFFIVCAAIALGLVGCGGDDEKEATTGVTTSTATQPSETATTTTETRAPTETEAPETATEPTEGSPEDQPGGAGDEEPARTLALFTGRDGRLTPRVVRVPPYISVRVELRSADAGEYALAFDGKRLKAGGALSSVSTTFDGLRPGAALTGTGTGGEVRIEASAEPGP